MNEELLWTVVLDADIIKNMLTNNAIRRLESNVSYVPPASTITFTKWVKHEKLSSNEALCIMCGFYTKPRNNKPTLKSMYIYWLLKNDKLTGLRLNVYGSRKLLRDTLYDNHGDFSVKRIVEAREYTITRYTIH